MKHALLAGCLLVVFAGVFARPLRSGGEVAAGNVGAESAAQLYMKHCASCHGRDGRAKTSKAKLNHARNLADAEWQERASEERIFNAIMNGKGKMPGYGKKLSEAQIELVVAYVRGLRR
jgi:mono/diheme cytochrome c family protein